MRLGTRFGIVGSREFKSYDQLSYYLDTIVRLGDTIVSGGAVGVDSMAQRYAKEHGLRILVIYPDYAHYGRGATFVRNKEIVEESDEVVAFYARGRFQEGGTANTASWARKLGVKLTEIEES